MVNSSLRNTMARRNHKERAQPLHRQRLGLLEKHKDYAHRAKDYKSKQDRIRKLREKAAFRNKDEFYWGMVKGKTKGGVVVADRGNEELSNEIVRLLKTQDVGYVRVQIAKDEKKIAKLRAQLEILTPGAGPSTEWDAAAESAEVEKLAEMGVVINPYSASSGRKGKGKAQTAHIVFADDASEFQTYGASSSVDDSNINAEDEELDLGWEEPESSTKKKKTTGTVEKKEESLDPEDAREHRMELLSNLSALLARLKALRQAETRLEATRAQMGLKGGKAKLVRDSAIVDDPTAKEDRNGEKKRFEGKIWKFKLERRR